MKAWGRYLICGVLGIAAGTGYAIYSVRAGALGSNETIGQWTTGKDFGTERASAYTRAVVALYGLLALPASEARYYTATVDDMQQPLDARCRYRITGGALPARWWSLTLYDPAGYLVENPIGVYSIGSMGLPDAEKGKWSIVAAPAVQPGHWLPTGGTGNFVLTLRAYLPADGGKGNFTRAQLPHIEREAC